MWTFLDCETREDMQTKHKTSSFKHKPLKLCFPSFHWYVNASWGRHPVTSVGGRKQRSRNQNKTRTRLRRLRKGYSSLFLITDAVRPALKATHKPQRSKHCKKKEKHRAAMESTDVPDSVDSSRWWLEVENNTCHPSPVRCPTRRATRERKANALTVAEMSRKMEPVRPQLEVRLRLRLRPETSDRVVRERTRTQMYLS